MRGDEKLVEKSELKKALERIKRPEHLLGHKTEEVKNPKGRGQSWSRNKTDMADHARCGGCRIKTAARALDVSRIVLYERKSANFKGEPRRSERNCNSC